MPDKSACVKTYTPEGGICLLWLFGFHSDSAVVCLYIFEPAFGSVLLCWLSDSLLCFGVFGVYYSWTAGNIVCGGSAVGVLARDVSGLGLKVGQHMYMSD